MRASGSGIRIEALRETVWSVIRKVLARAGFAPVGPAGPADIGGKQGTLYRRDLGAEESC